MNAHTTTYYVIRALVRFVFAFVALFGFILLIHAAAELWWTAVLLAAALWGVFILQLRRQAIK